MIKKSKLFSYLKCSIIFSICCFSHYVIAAKPSKLPKDSFCDSEGFLSPTCYKTEYSDIHRFDAWLDKLKINGWLDLDAAKYTHYPAATPFSSGAIIRTARINFRGQVEKNWRYSFGFAFFDNAVSVKQAFLAYTGIPQTEIRIGQMKVPFSLDHLINDRYSTFLESALPIDVLTPEYRLGSGIFHYGNIFSRDHFYTASAGVYTNKAGDKSSHVSGSISGIMRVTYGYEPNKRRLIMAGLGVDVSSPDSTHVVVYEGFPESRVSTNLSSRLVHTGDIDVSYVEKYDPQAAVVVGPLSLQSEYIENDVYRMGADPTLHLNGWYELGSWILTGESRRYDTRNAIFTGVEPAHHYGAWELTERFSRVNLNSHSVLGGVEKNYTAGLNWYVNPSIRFMLNYIKAYSDRQGVHSSPDIYTVRGEVDFP